MNKDTKITITRTQFATVSVGDLLEWLKIDEMPTSVEAIEDLLSSNYDRDVLMSFHSDTELLRVEKA